MSCYRQLDTCFFLALYCTGFVMQKILVIEDEPLTLKIIEFLLKKAGHQVYASSNGLEAKAYLLEFSPDLILTDMMIPGMSGLEIVTLVRNELKRSTPIILLSASEVDWMVEQGLRAGADHFMSKPFSPKELESCVNEYLKNSF